MTFADTFDTLHDLAGNPTMDCVKPYSAWTDIPAGYSYNASGDVFMNVGGTTWRPTLADEPATSIDILPTNGAEGIELSLGGLVETGDRYVIILPASKTTTDACFAVLLDGTSYNIKETTAIPAGAAQWYTLRLVKR